jgi:hypothetical protein
VRPDFLRIVLLLLTISTAHAVAAPIPDEPFWQDVAVRIRHADSLSNAVFRRVCVDQENGVYVLTDRGMARVYEDILAPDLSYRPLAESVPLDITVSGGDLFLLYPGQMLSNARNGTWAQPAPAGVTWVEPLPDGTVAARNGSRPTPAGPRGRAPVDGVTARVDVAGGVWFGSPRGAYFERDGTSARYATPSAPGIEPPAIRYYAGKRWLRDDAVVDLAVDRDGHLWVLTATGLSKIEFRRTTLSEKARWFSRKIRSRNVRYGLTAERRMRIPGDIASSEMIDTDNDGGWTSYYIGALGAQWAVTRDSEARRQAWDAFGALERLQSIHTNTGFPARTIERRGFKYSDTDRWRDAPDRGWEWKGHTSSDEIQAQCFAHAVMWELVATNAAEKARITANWIPVVDHILRNNLYLIDSDGEATLWGRWHPEYVNWFPHSIVDRRLNSAEITAALQLAYRMTGKESYKAKALELFEKQGYLENILSPMKLIGPTTGFVFRGNDMGNEWNHSDDELAFFTYWVLSRFAFDEGLQTKYRAAVADHWSFEQPERYAIWNFLYAGCGGKEHDPAGAVWTLRGVPLDTIAWRVANSHRKDITRLNPNFQGRELKELLPPGERLIARINTQPFILDQGDDTTDFPGDEYLLGYWLGRFVGSIGPEQR